MSDPELIGNESKEQLEEVLQRHIARERAAIRLGFPLAVVVLIFLAVWFIIWRANAGPVEKALVEIRSRRIELPKSRFTYAIDGAPLLEMQWGRGKIPTPPLHDSRALDFLVIEKSGQWVLVPAEEGEHQGLVLAADSAATTAAISRILQHEMVRGRCGKLWFAARTSEIVGSPGEEMKLKALEMSDLGVLPISLRYFRVSLPQGVFALPKLALAPSDTFADAVKRLDAAYEGGRRDSLLLEIQAARPQPTPSQGPEE